MPAKPIVTNSTPLVAFWSIQRLDILQALFGEIHIPMAVWQEFLAIEKEERSQMLDDNPWIHVVELERPVRAKAFAGLDVGEAETLALAEELDAGLVLVDERKARRYAERMELPLSGSMGLLLLAKEAGIVESIAPLIGAMEDAGLFLGSELKKAVLSRAGES